MSTREQGVPASVKCVIVVVDLAGFTKLFQTRTDQECVAFLQRYYAECETTLGVGRVIKFMGDACLATFPADAARAAVAAVVALERKIELLCAEEGLRISLGASLHLAEVIDVELGQSRRRDVIGRGVNQAFLLGRGTGVRISEPVYRQLASAERSAWKKHKPPAVYSLDGASDVYAGLGKDAAQNALRW